MTPQPPRRSAGWGMVRATLQGDEPRQSNASDSGPQPRLSGVARLSGAEPQPRMSGALAGFAATAIARERQRKRDGGGDDATAPAAADDVASPPVARRSFTGPARAAGRARQVRAHERGRCAHQENERVGRAAQVDSGRRREQEGVGGGADAARRPSPQHAPPPIPGRRKSTFQAAASALSGLATTPSMHAHGFGTDAATAAAAALRRQGSKISLNAGGGGGGGGDSFKSSVSRKASVARPTWAVAAPPPPTTAAVGGASLERAARGEAAVEHGVSRDVQRARLRHAARHAHPGGVGGHPARPPRGGAGGGCDRGRGVLVAQHVDGRRHSAEHDGGASVGPPHHRRGPRQPAVVRAGRMVQLARAILYEGQEADRLSPPPTSPPPPPHRPKTPSMRTRRRRGRRCGAARTCR